MNDRTRRLVDVAPGIVAVATFGAVALAAILGFESAVPVLAVLGWFVLTPLSAILGHVLVPDEEGEDATETTPESAPNPTPESDPVERLRERYAAGDIDEEEFERRLDLLLDTEGVDAVTARERLRSRETDHESAAEVERER
ncbi:SHOCT domain-containing protein [Halobaculum lipolyticum]|uniref:SHOCT domain-containing protein n=1 Tax=Halobaculum lipolyticum TaxID=3032001 RepID=A0ABD5W865_9EURY|nr:SHOCT domain-containing protein [Halobaculum sp. DT31]